MKPALPLFAAIACTLPFSSCSVPGSAAMDELRKGMSKEQVRGVMQSHGLKPDDSRKRPSGGWEAYGHDPFAAGSMANEFEQKTGQRVTSAEVYHVAGPSGSSVINLYYDREGKLIR